MILPEKGSVERERAVISEIRTTTCESARALIGIAPVPFPTFFALLSLASPLMAGLSKMGQQVHILSILENPFSYNVGGNCWTNCMLYVANKCTVRQLRATCSMKLKIAQDRFVNDRFQLQPMHTGRITVECLTIVVLYS